MTEANTATYDNEVYQRGGVAENVNEDLQICVGTSELETLDIDGDGETKALTDGLLGLRVLFGFTGTISSAGGRHAELHPLHAPRARVVHRRAQDLDIIDIDGNGNPDALTDGLLFLRYLFGFRGDTLIAGAVAAGAPRDTAHEIEAYIAGLI